MPISYELDHTTCRVRTTVTGPVTVDDILGHFKAACQEQTLPYAELIDTREASPPFLSPTDIWHAADRVRAMEFDRRSLGPRAVIVKDLGIFGLVRMFITLMSDCFPMNVFLDPLEAEVWLAEQSGRKP
jgi:hypothetical protein